MMDYLPLIPDSLTTPQERGNFLTAHFWDRMNFSDTALSLDTAFMEQGFADFLAIAGAADEDALRRGMRILVKRAAVSTETLAFMTHIAEKYLYEPNSPMLNESMFIIWGNELVASPEIDETNKIRMHEQLRIAKKNRPGDKATDFRFVDREGKTAKLSEWITAGTETETLLIFYDPDCENCKEIIKDLSMSQTLAQLQNSGQVRVIAIYPGADKALWKKKLDGMPAGWTVGIATEDIEEEEKYIFPAMPVIYLLDGNGRVKVKDLSATSFL